MGNKNAAYNAWLKAQKKGYEGTFEEYIGGSFEEGKYVPQDETPTKYTLTQDYSNWASIASDVYGDERMTQQLMEANYTPNGFYAGMTINLPPQSANPYVSYDWMAQQMDQQSGIAGTYWSGGQPTEEFWATQPAYKQLQDAIATGDYDTADKIAYYLPNDYRGQVVRGAAQGAAQAAAPAATQTQTNSQTMSDLYATMYGTDAYRQWVEQNNMVGKTLGEYERMGVIGGPPPTLPTGGEPGRRSDRANRNLPTGVNPAIYDAYYAPTVISPRDMWDSLSNVGAKFGINQAEAEKFLNTITALITPGGIGEIGARQIVTGTSPQQDMYNKAAQAMGISLQTLARGLLNWSKDYDEKYRQYIGENDQTYLQYLMNRPGGLLGSLPKGQAEPRAQNVTTENANVDAVLNALGIITGAGALGATNFGGGQPFTLPVGAPNTATPVSTPAETVPAANLEPVPNLLDTSLQNTLPGFNLNTSSSQAMIDQWVQDPTVSALILSGQRDAFSPEQLILLYQSGYIPEDWLE